MSSIFILDLMIKKIMSQSKQRKIYPPPKSDSEVDPVIKMSSSKILLNHGSFIAQTSIQHDPEMVMDTCF